MKKIIKYIIAAVLCFFVYRLIVVPGEIGTIDTTGKAPAWLTAIAIIIALGLFVWSITKINKNN